MKKENEHWKFSAFEKLANNQKTNEHRKLQFTKQSKNKTRK
jgi:hypothetical protein